MTDLMIRRVEAGLRCHRSCTEWRYRGITAPATCTPTPATIVLGLLLGPAAWSCHLRLSSRKYCSVQQTRGCYESSAAVVLALVILHYCVQQYNMDYNAEKKCRPQDCLRQSSINHLKYMSTADFAFEL